MFSLLLYRFNRKITNFLCVPIRVFVFHQVSSQFDERGMWDCDWTEIEQFKKNILTLCKDYTFISLECAYNIIQKDNFRMRKYAVLTADDGWSSVLSIIPWLWEHNIPITLFLNPFYLDGNHKQEREAEKLLTEEDIRKIILDYSNVSIASHGWTHRKCTEMSDLEFVDSVERAQKYLLEFHSVVPFYAFTYGYFKNNQLDILQRYNLIPVLVDGQRNHKKSAVIHRECIDGITL